MLATSSSSIFSKPPKIHNFLSVNGAKQGFSGVRQVGPILMQRLRQDYRVGLLTGRIGGEGSERVREEKLVPFGLFSGEAEHGWICRGNRGVFEFEDKEALMKIKSGASSSDGTKGIKRDNADKKESDESHVKKPKVSSDLNEINFSESEVKDKYKDANLAPNWKAFSTVIFREREEGLNDSAKIAAFDFDGCLANTNVRKVGADAWSLMYPTIPDKLKELYNDGYKLVIFTNEANIERWKNKRQQAVDSKIGRLNNFIKLVNLPIQVFIACGTTIKEVQDPFRKPNPGLWKLMEQHFNSQISIDYDQSFYVGDAAGRDNDHSDADIEFAKANGLKFFVPEEYFDVE